ncbi:MAG: argininosuccinate lyase, partial [Gammaproteobacteria bacterium]
ETRRELTELTLDELHGFSAAIKQDVFDILEPQGSVAARNHLGGTAPAQVRAAIARAKEQLAH